MINFDIVFQNKNIEQNNIKNKYSLEADQPTDENPEDTEIPDFEDTEYANVEEEGGTEDSGQTEDSSYDDGGSVDDSGSGETEGKLGDVTSSSLNPFTQVNQRKYLLRQMNELSKSVQNAIDKYSSIKAETVEYQQLIDLLEIIEDGEKAMMMQQNPENLIKYELYLTRFEEIIQTLSKENKNFDNK